MNKLNTSSNSLERIYVPIFTPDVNIKTYNTVDSFITQLCKLETELINKGVINITVKIESDDNFEPNNRIYLMGYVLESNTEYKRRLENIIWSMNRNKESHDERIEYYKSENHQHRLDEINNLLHNIANENK